MKKNRWILMLCFSALFSFGLLYAQTDRKPQAPNRPEITSAGDVQPAAVQEQLFRFLRMSPRLTVVLSYDPTLLRYPDYVGNNNPELAAFLQNHPEVGRNPEFYLFTRMGGNEYIPSLYQRSVDREMNYQKSGDDMIFLLLLWLGIMGGILWLLRMFWQNRRWNRIFKVQTDIHTKLLDKLSGSQELFTYLDTETGRKFLEFAPIAAAIESPRQSNMLSPISRILAPLQLGIVMTLAGIGILFIKWYYNTIGALVMIGPVVIAIGIGFILSAIISWVLARRFGLMNPAKPESSVSGHE